MADELLLNVMDPTGIASEKQMNYAPRLPTLEEKTVGLVWNTKPNGDLLLDEVGVLLRKRYPSVRLASFSTSLSNAVSSSGTPPPPGRIESIAAEVDAVVYAEGG